nr:hypothetical protein Iba_chr10aCG6070 [Ipomoea batatas]
MGKYKLRKKNRKIEPGGELEADFRGDEEELGADYGGEEAEPVDDFGGEEAEPWDDFGGEEAEAQSELGSDFGGHHESAVHEDLLQGSTSSPPSTIFSVVVSSPSLLHSRSAILLHCFHASESRSAILLHLLSCCVACASRL